MTATARKLAELRAKTDRELVRVIDNALEVVLLLATSDTQNDSERRGHGRAQEIYASTVMLLPKVEDVSERRRLEGGMKELREGLEERRSEGAVL